MAWQDEAPPPDYGPQESAPKQRARPPRAFEDSEGVRSKQRAFIAMSGPSNSGKTKTALEIGAGLVSVTGGRVFVVDTENGRALKYAPPKGVAPSPIDAAPEGKTYSFRHVPLEPPFDPDSYLEALQHCEAHGAGCVIFDSMSHEHAGEGGRLDSHDKIMGNNPKKNYAAWRPSTDARNRLLWGGFMRSRCHIIMCFRAKDKTEQRGSTIVDMGFSPVGGAEFLFECDVGFLFMPGAKGAPTFKSTKLGEQTAYKLPDEYRNFFRESESLSWRHGQRIAQWLDAGGAIQRNTQPAAAPPAAAAGGGQAPTESPPPPPAPPSAAPPIDDGDFFPGDVKPIELAGARYFANAPKPIPLANDAANAELQQWGATLRELMAAAPTTQAMREWETANADGLLLVAARSQKLLAWIKQPITGEAA